MNSMTGYGKGSYRDDRMEIAVELKTINHRYKDFFIRMPRTLNFAEDALRKEIGKTVQRGRIEVHIKIQYFGLENKEIRLDLELAKAYMESLKELKTQLPEVTGEYGLSLVARFPEVIYTEEKEGDEGQLWNKLSQALQEALKGLAETRQSEGALLAEDFLHRLEAIEKITAGIQEMEPVIAQENAVKLRSRIEEYTKELALDEKRLVEEVAYLADKASIAEEITRLKSHCTRFRKIMKEKDSVGRKLDFLIQEMHREINTIGSKSNHLDLSNLVVDVKSEIEKMREQIQNIE